MRFKHPIEAKLDERPLLRRFVLALNSRPVSVTMPRGDVEALTQQCLSMMQQTQQVVPVPASGKAGNLLGVDIFVGDVEEWRWSWL